MKYIVEYMDYEGIMAKSGPTKIYTVECDTLREAISMMKYLKSRDLLAIRIKQSGG